LTGPFPLAPEEWALFEAVLAAMKAALVIETEVAS